MEGSADEEEEEEDSATEDSDDDGTDLSAIEEVEEEEEGKNKLLVLICGRSSFEILCRVFWESKVSEQHTRNKLRKKKKKHLRDSTFFLSQRAPPP